MLNAAPDKSDYRGWQMQKYYEDSLDWETNPVRLVRKEHKEGRKQHNLYTDGLKIYTTIDSRMQNMQRMPHRHLKELQAIFPKRRKVRRKRPYTFRLTQEQVDEILDRAMRLSDRYRIMKRAGASSGNRESVRYARTNVCIQLER